MNIVSIIVSTVLLFYINLHIFMYYHIIGMLFVIKHKWYLSFSGGRNLQFERDLQIMIKQWLYLTLKMLKL